MKYCLPIVLFLACTAPTSQSSFATLTNGSLSVSVDPTVGGRISSLQYDGVEVLKTTRDPANLQWGSTVWLSPQSAWGWPPHATFDSDPYTLERPEENTLLLKSAVDSATQLQLYKQLTLTDDALDLTFTLHNRGDSTRTYGLWSNTRLPYAGHLLFQRGDSIRVEKIADPVERYPAMTVIRFEDRHPKNGKVFADLRDGGVTYYSPDSLAFTQRSTLLDYAAVAPGQAPLEVYLAPEDGFAEFEMQGPHRAIAPGDSLVFDLQWTIGKSEN